MDPADLELVFLLHHEDQRNGHGVVDLPLHHSCSWGKLWAGANEPRGAAFQFTLPDAVRELTAPLQASQRI